MNQSDKAHSRENRSAFFTPVNLPDSKFEINYTDNLFTLGSCFAENIGKKLQDAFFLSFINPFGVLYNPLSVCRSVRYLLNGKEFTGEDLFQSGSLWNSFAHSSLFSAIEPGEALQKINSRLAAARFFLNETNVMMITLGTAWIFEDAATGEVVSNCHKLPANSFNRRRMSVDEVVNSLSEVINLLRQSNPAMKFVFTVSPVRHWKDGAHENTVSKSTLHLAVDVLVKEFPFVQYFPAYEIVIDELRDYRFYTTDMLHPSEQTVEYIWQCFAGMFFSESTLKLKKELEQLRTDLNHRPLHPDTAEYQLFVDRVEKKKNGLIKDYPFLKERFV